MQRDYFLKHKANPEKAADALANAFIEELNVTVPGPAKHPNATGNLLSALTARSEVRVSGYLYWVGVGDMSRLGKPGERTYRPKPIKRFLDWYRKQADVEATQRDRAREQLVAVRAERAKARAEARKLREEALRKYNRQLWYNHVTRQFNARIRKLYNRWQSLEDSISRWKSRSAELAALFSRTGHEVWRTRRDRMDDKIDRLQKRSDEAYEQLQSTSEALINWQRDYFK